MSETTRRQFVTTVTAGLAATAPLSAHARGARPAPITPQPLSYESSGAITPRERPKQGLILGFGVSKERHDQPEWDLWLSTLDLDSDPVRLHRIAMPSFAHGIVPNPNDPNLLVTFQKRGRGGTEVSLKTGEVLRTIDLAPERQFYGHGAYSADGSLLYATETIVGGAFEGKIAVRDSKTHKYLGDFPSYGSSPHDSHLIDNGAVMAITNGGGPIRGGTPPNVAFVDVATQKLIEKLEFDDADMNAGHLSLSARGDLVVVSSFRDGLEDKPNVKGGISIRPAGGAFRTLKQPSEIVAQMLGETLSVCIDENSHTAAATTPMGNLLTFWDVRSGDLLRAEVVPQPKGVTLTLDGAYYVVTYTVEGRSLTSFWSAKTLTREPNLDLIDTYQSGSHIVTYSLTS